MSYGRLMYLPLELRGGTQQALLWLQLLLFYAPRQLRCARVYVLAHALPMVL